MGVMEGSAHDAWYEAFGRAFLGEGTTALHHGLCESCGEQRSDLLKKNRMICVRCAPMAAKKPKREGGRAGPSANQCVLITGAQAIYAGPIAAPPGLPPSSKCIDQHGERFLAHLLYAPPEPPFWLMHLAMNSDPVMGNTRLTRDLRRLHIGAVVPAVIDQPLLRDLVDLLATHPQPQVALRQLAAIHSPLARGPAADAQRWEWAMDQWEALQAQCPALTERFDDQGLWPTRPGDGLWPWLERLVGLKVRGEL